MGKYIKPGVHVKEIDLSNIVPPDIECLEFVEEVAIPPPTVMLGMDEIKKYENELRHVEEDWIEEDENWLDEGEGERIAKMLNPPIVDW